MGYKLMVNDEAINATAINADAINYTSDVTVSEAITSLNNNMETSVKVEGGWDAYYAIPESERKSGKSFYVKTDDNQYSAQNIVYDAENNVSVADELDDLNDTMIKSKTYTFSGFTTSANSWKELLTIDYSSIGASEVLGVVPLYFSASANTLFSLSLNVSKNRLYLITASSVTVNDLALTILYR